MISEKINEIAEAKERVRLLEEELKRQRQLELASLPEKFGFSNVEDLIAAIRAAFPQRRPTGGRRPYIRTTESMRKELARQVQAGATASTIAEQLGISVANVAKLKREMGLSKARGNNTRRS